jgi:hypothetical protein
MNNALLFETPWWLPTVIVLVGGVVAYTANQRREMRLRATGLAIIVLGIALALLSYVVDTDRERAVKQTRQLVSSFANKDWETMRGLLHPKASVGVANSMTLYTDRDQIVAGAKTAAERYGFKSLTITSLEARQDQTIITVTLNVLSIQDQTGGRPITSSWEFDWLESANGWSLYKIRAVQIGNQQSDRLERMFPGRGR